MRLILRHQAQHMHRCTCTAVPPRASTRAGYLPQVSQYHQQEMAQMPHTQNYLPDLTAIDPAPANAEYAANSPCETKLRTATTMMNITNP